MLTFEELYEQYAKDIYRFAYWLTHNVDVAKEITSETFVKVWTKTSDIKTETMKGLLLTIAKNIYLDYLRKNKRLVSTEKIRNKITYEIEQEYETKEKLESVYLFLSEFKEIDKTAFLLKVQQGMSYEEIARILNISVSLAKVKVYRVRKKIIENFISMEN